MQCAGTVMRHKSLPRNLHILWRVSETLAQNWLWIKEQSNACKIPFHIGSSSKSRTGKLCLYLSVILKSLEISWQNEHGYFQVSSPDVASPPFLCLCMSVHARWPAAKESHDVLSPWTLIATGTTIHGSKMPFKILSYTGMPRLRIL